MCKPDIKDNETYTFIPCFKMFIGNVSDLVCLLR